MIANAASSAYNVAVLSCPIKKKSKEATMDLDKPTTGEQDYWEIKDEEHQQPM